jgi:branched-chain amino acid transport system permease protein
MGVSAYVSGWLFLKFGLGHLVSAPLALLLTTLMAALFGLIALRASGIGFLMITLALGQVLWGLAFRWVTVTNGDNGLSGLTRPMPFGIDLNGANAFYFFTLLVAAASFACIVAFANSAFGAVLRGTRDQPRRMLALGHNVWLVRYVTFITAGFWAAVSGLLFVYYHKFIHPHALGLTNSAETLLMVIAGGSGTLIGPIVGAAVVVLLKNYVSAFVERWTMLLGFVFLIIVLFMPDGLVPGVQRLWARLKGKSGAKGQCT